MSRTLLLLCLSLAMLGWTGIATADSLPATVVARSGQDVPGVSGATFANSLGASPRLGAGGHVAFNGFINGGGAVNSTDFGYWAGTPGNLHLVLREDSQNSGPDLFPGLSNAGVAANGDVSLWTQLAFPVPNNANQILVNYLAAGGTASIASEGATIAPGFAGGVFSTIGSGQAWNNSGAVAFVGDAIGGDVSSGTEQALWAGAAGSLQLVARRGFAAPGATGTTPVFSTLYDKRINASGQVGFATALSGAGVNAINDRVIYAWSPGGGGSLALAAQTGSVAPGTSPTITFLQIDDRPGFNDAGQVVFRGQLTSDVPGELNLVNNFGIWAGAPGAVQLVARSGIASPIAGLSLRTPEPNPRINASGQVAFFSFVAGSGVNSNNDRVYWASTPTGALFPVAREGSAAPGAGTGVTFGTLDALATINNQGQVALTATLAGTGVTGTNNRGLWVGTPNALSLVARLGDVIDVDPGAAVLLKTISAISFASGLDGQVFDSGSAALNDSGQVAWRATFTDSTTAIMLTSVALPGLSADFDSDHDVDANDLAAWKTGFGKSGNAAHAQGDADYDFDVDGDDLLIWQRQLGATVPVAAVPEPAAWALATWFCAILICRGGTRAGRC